MSEVPLYRGLRRTGILATGLGVRERCFFSSALLLSSLELSDTKVYEP